LTAVGGLVDLLAALDRARAGDDAEAAAADAAPPMSMKCRRASPRADTSYQASKTAPGVGDAASSVNMPGIEPGPWLP
jgi:hypothetical protein